MTATVPGFLPRGAQLSQELARAGLNGRTRQRIEDRFFAGLRKTFRASGTRMDLVMTRPLYRAGSRNYVEVTYSGLVGLPELPHLVAFLQRSYPGHEPILDDISTIQARRPGDGALRIALQEQHALIPLRSASALPPDFTRVGTGLFRRRGDDHHLWALERVNGQYALVRRQQEQTQPTYGDEADLSRTAGAAPLAQDPFRVGARAQVPTGEVGKIVGFDRVGNPRIDTGHPEGPRLYRRSQVMVEPSPADPGLPPDHSKTGYSLEREKSFLTDAWEAILGDRDYATKLVNDQYGRTSG